MEWESPSIALLTHPFGESDILATIFTEEQGVVRGLVRGGASRAKSVIFQPGNILKTRWVGRLPDQLGQFSAEMVHPGAAGAMNDRMALAMLQSLAAITAGALPERDPYSDLFDALLRLMVRLPEAEELLPDLVRYEAALLAELGYGMDLSGSDLAYVSPRTGRGVSAETAGEWSDRLLKLPGFLCGGEDGDRGDWLAGLRLTAHFLTRDVFGVLNRPLPAARQMLYDLVVSMAPDSIE
jgi:DNA repair protein RecO (recombination protein O)